MTAPVASCSCGQLQVPSSRLLEQECRDAPAPMRPSDSGFSVAFHFCPHCGSTVYWEPRRKPDTIAVALGAFGDPSFPGPTQSVWTERGHPRVVTPDCPRRLRA
jgi:hypothetical protein